jgi:hypothetical protein
MLLYWANENHRINFQFLLVLLTHALLIIIMNFAYIT